MAYKKQELWLTLVQRKAGQEVARTQAFRVNPEATIGNIMDVKENLLAMSGPNVTWEYENEWRDIQPDVTLIDGTGRGRRG